MSSLARVWRRDWQIQLQNVAHTLTPLVFFLAVVSIFAIGNNLNPGVIWAAVLLAVVLSMQTIFRDEYNSGIFGYILLTSMPNILVVLSKVICHWLSTQLPIIILTPLVMIDTTSAEIGVMVLAMSIGSLALCLIGAVVAALTVALPQGGVLLSVLSIPLYMPVLMLGLSSSYAAAHNLPVGGYIALLAAFTLILLWLAPMLVCALMKVNMQ